MIYDTRYLVALMYAGANTCCTNVVHLHEKRFADAKVDVDAVGGTWSMIENGKKITIPIGQSRYIDHACRYGVIGIYSSTNIKHLDMMVRDSKEATTNHSDRD